MKKLLALLLTVVMVLSIMVPVVAEEADTEVATPEAPVLRSVQLKKVTDESNNTTYNVRFLSTVDSLSGSVLGYEISALFNTTDGEGNTTPKHVIYAYDVDDENTHNLQSNRVYKSINVYDAEGNKETVDAKTLAANAKVSDTEDVSNEQGIFAVAIEGVPNNADVIFTVKSYVLFGNEEIASEVLVAKYDVENEEVKISAIKENVYQQNFDALSGVLVSLGAGHENPFATTDYKRQLLADFTDTAVSDFNTTLAAKLPGWKITAINNYNFRKSDNTSKDQTVTVTNGAVVLNGGASTYQVVAPGTLANQGVYTIDMDLSIASLGQFDILFNNSVDVGYYNGAAQSLVFRDITDTAVTGANKAGTNAIGVTLFGFSHTSTGLHTGNISYPTSNDVSKYADTGATYGNTFHLTLLVDNATTKTVTVFVNGTVVALTDNSLTNSTSGGLEFMFQNSEVTIDNIVVRGTATTSSAQ